MRQSLLHLPPWHRCNDDDERCMRCGVVVVERAGLNNGVIPVFDSYLQSLKVGIVGKYVLREHLDLVAAQVPSN